MTVVHTVVWSRDSGDRWVQSWLSHSLEEDLGQAHPLVFWGFSESTSGKHLGTGQAQSCHCQNLSSISYFLHYWMFRIQERSNVFKLLAHLKERNVKTGLQTLWYALNIYIFIIDISSICYLWKTTWFYACNQKYSAAYFCCSPNNYRITSDLWLPLGVTTQPSSGSWTLCSLGHLYILINNSEIPENFCLYVLSVTVYLLEMKPGNNKPIICQHSNI